MPSNPTFLVHIVVIFLGAIVMPGCAAINQHINGMLDAMSIRGQERRELARIRQDTRRELADEREEAMKVESERQIQQARIDAERQRLEMQFCIGKQEQEQRQIKDNIKQSVESKVAFNVEQQLEVGELEVDTEALKLLLEKRESPPPSQNQVVPNKPCPCCDQPCGCRPGLLRRHCPFCRHKRCEAEEKCGGPEMYSQLQEQPQKQPLRPAEIPMKLPVKLSFGFQQPQVEKTQIRTQPQIDTPPKCATPVVPCTQPAGTPLKGPVKGADTSIDKPPVPEPDTDVSTPTPIDTSRSTVPFAPTRISTRRIQSESE